MTDQTQQTNQSDQAAPSLTDQHVPHAPRPQRTPAEVQEQMRVLDGFAGAAGQELTDRHHRDVLRLQLAGEISGDEARRRITER